MRSGGATSVRHPRPFSETRKPADLGEFDGLPEEQQQHGPIPF